MIFFGNLGYFHNVEPRAFVAAEVVAAGPQPAPEAGAANSPGPTRARRLPPIEARRCRTGRLRADLIGELPAAAVAVLPMFSGSGIKNKVLEAFALGLPVVASLVRVRGSHRARSRRALPVGEGADKKRPGCSTIARAGDGQIQYRDRGLMTWFEKRCTFNQQTETMLPPLYGPDPLGSSYSGACRDFESEVATEHPSRRH